VRKYELKSTLARASLPSARAAQSTYIVRASVVEREDWQGVSRAPHEPSELEEASSAELPVPECEPLRDAQPPPEPSMAIRAEVTPTCTVIRERDDVAADLSVSRDERATPVARHITHAVLASEALSEARFLLEADKHKEALQCLEDYLATDPEHETCRAMLLVVCIALRLRSRVAHHAEWLVARYRRQDADLSVCDVYARVVSGRIDLVWKEASLIAVVAAAGRVGQGTIVIDATNRLLRGYPESFGLPQALFAASEQQVAAGRGDLAQRTLEHIVAEYPLSVVAFRAQETLRRLRRA
jgi:hypothetical protein